MSKAGKETRVLSGVNTFTRPATVKQGTLALASGRSLAAKTVVAVELGATLELGFKGSPRGRQLTLEGKPQRPGNYSATTSPEFIQGVGVLSVES